MQLLGKLRKVAEENDADIIAADFHSSANRDRGKAGVSSIEEAWGRHFCQIKESGDCCGFTTTKKSEPSWRVARHGSKM